MFESDHSFDDWQLRMLHHDESFRALSLNLNRMETSFSQQLAHWRESLFSFCVENWLTVIRYNTTVETVTLDLSVLENTIWKKNQIRGLLIAIASLPKLRKLVLRQNNLGSPRRLHSLQAILGVIEENHSIECLELWGNEIVPGTEELLQEFETRIQDMQGLKSFKLLGFRLEPEHVQTFLPIMNKPSLTEFCLGNTSDGFVPVAEILKTNVNLEKLTLSFVNQVEDGNCLHLADALYYNTTLHMLSLLNTSPRDNHSGISARSESALVQMVKHNMTLKEIKTRGEPCDEICLYLKLNALGRRHLFQRGGVTPSIPDKLGSNRMSKTGGGAVDPE